MAQPNAVSMLGSNQPGPFTELLTQQLQMPMNQAEYRRIDPNAGWASGWGNVARMTNAALQGIKQERFTKNLRQQAEREQGVRDYQNYIQMAVLANPELTEDAKGAVLRDAAQAMYGHATEAVKSSPKGGFGAQVKNVLTELAGGKLPKVEPFSPYESIGRVQTTLASNPEFKRDYWISKANQDLARAKAELEQQYGKYYAPELLNAKLSSTYSDLVQHLGMEHAEQFQKVALSGVVSPELRRKTLTSNLISRYMEGIGGSDTVRPAGPSPAAAPPPTRSLTEQYLPMVAPVQTSVTGAPASASASSSAARTSGMPSFARTMIAEALGLKTSEPTTLYNREGTEYVTGVQRDPLTQVWVKADTGEALPDHQQQWVPHNEIKFPPSGSYESVSAIDENGNIGLYSRRDLKSDPQTGQLTDRQGRRLRPTTQTPNERQLERLEGWLSQQQMRLAERSSNRKQQLMINISTEMITDPEIKKRSWEMLQEMDDAEQAMLKAMFENRKRLLYGEPTRPIPSEVKGPVGARLNNPGNIKDPNTGEFRNYGSPQEGWDALKNQVSRYISGAIGRGLGPQSTLEEMGSVYAPVGDGDNDPIQWAANVAGALGVSPKTKIGTYANNPLELARGIAVAEGTWNTMRTSYPGAPPAVRESAEVAEPAGRGRPAAPVSRKEVDEWIKE